MSSSTHTTSRILPFPIEKVRKAWTTPVLLATWWGPAGFTNEFEICDITPDGDWKFTMISPEGVRYPNVSKWLKIADDHVSLEHIVDPHFFLWADFEAVGEETKITWTMKFDTPETLEALNRIIIPANEENLDRLEECLAKI